MAETDIIICGGGVTLFEAAALGIPAITIANELHEVQTVQWFERNGFGCYTGFRSGYMESRLLASLTKLISDSTLHNKMSGVGKTLVDGGGLKKIVSKIREVDNE
jgi:spore coat polysaccharide biosynthesis predicted glycosyltransferase SpsG